MDDGPYRLTVGAKFLATWPAEWQKKHRYIDVATCSRLLYMIQRWFSGIITSAYKQGVFGRITLLSLHIYRSIFLLG